MTCKIVIPARLASTRLPEKLLLKANGKSVLQHTYEAASRARIPSGIIVAVDDARLLNEVNGFGGTAQMTDVNAASGTDRVAEVARGLPDISVFINVQGDEPEIDGTAIDKVAQLLIDHPQADVATLATPIRSKADYEDPACVKVICDRHQRALYFSRSPIPCDRNRVFDWASWEMQASNQNLSITRLDSPFLQHLGIYAYRREFLMGLKNLPESPLEQFEKLEQLRFLEAGCSILVGIVEHRTRGIDTQADYEAFVSRLRNC